LKGIVTNTDKKFPASFVDYKGVIGPYNGRGLEAGSVAALTASFFKWFEQSLRSGSFHSDNF